MNYWQNFYKNKKLQKEISYPSQFAIFSLNERNYDDTIIEFGCGNGRDSYFFSKYFKNVFAYDKSINAINLNKKNYNKQKNLFFGQFDINNKFKIKFYKKKKKNDLCTFFFTHFKRFRN